jgi:hypothetical protein
MKGDNITCVCKGEGGNPPANVTWYKAGRIVSETGKEKQALVLSDVDKNNHGKYKCVAFSHKLAENETTIDLVVQCKLNSGCLGITVFVFMFNENYCTVCTSSHSYCN